MRAAVSPLATAPRRAAAAPLRSSAAPLLVATDLLRAAAASLRADAAQLPAAAAPLPCRFYTEQQQHRYGLPPPPWVSTSRCRRFPLGLHSFAKCSCSATCRRRCSSGPRRSDCQRRYPGRPWARSGPPGRAGPGKICKRCSTFHDGGSLLSRPVRLRVAHSARLPPPCP